LAQDNFRGIQCVDERWNDILYGQLKIA